VPIEQLILLEYFLNKTRESPFATGFSRSRFAKIKTCGAILERLALHNKPWTIPSTRPKKAECAFCLFARRMEKRIAPPATPTTNKPAIAIAPQSSLTRTSDPDAAPEWRRPSFRCRALELSLGVLALASRSNRTAQMADPLSSPRKENSDERDGHHRGHEQTARYIAWKNSQFHTAACPSGEHGGRVTDRDGNFGDQEAL
jgi:hypothetical protein